MKHWRPIAWFLLSLACFIGAFYFWRLGDRWQAEKTRGAAATNAQSAPSNTASPAAPTKLTSSSVTHESTAPVIPSLHQTTNGIARRSTNFPYRLSNTALGIGELQRSPKAILLENALIDSSKPLNLDIPDKLQAHGDPGSYIVQADGTIDNAFRDRLKAAGLDIVSYIPNNAYLVTGTAAQVASFGSSAIPFEPYYKIKSALMPLALTGYKATAVNVAVFPGTLDQTTDALKQLGVTVGTQSPSPFGTELALQNVADIAAVASLPGIEIVEPTSPRMLENDLSRVIESVSVDPFTNGNYLGLTGSNVFVEVNDSWVPTNTAFNPAVTINPDLLDIVVNTNFFPQGIADFVGHATHVGGIISSSGLNSPTNLVPGSPQFDSYRGKAPLATLFAMPALSDVSDAQLQEAAANTNALISNNSWGYGSSTYDLAAASYDQAVRDSVPGQTGSQSVVYVFAAGNNGQGDDSGINGLADTLSSPAVGKNVISVGASELPRNITNVVTICDVCNTNNGCTTDTPWLGETDSSNEVASFSSRGNVGIGIEGQFGRFKPDVVAPGTFVVSTRSLTWDTNAYYNPITVAHTEFDGLTVQTNSIFSLPGTFVPCDSIELVVSAISVTPTNVPMPIYGSTVDFPLLPADLLGTNTVTAPGDFPLVTDTQWSFGVGNITNRPVTFNISADVVETNAMGDYFDVLRTNLNDQLLSSNGGPFYRYETGTSMAAPSVSGVLALIEDFFTNRMPANTPTPSPALMKALLINGARSINSIYDYQVQNNINYQGWGLINLTNSLPTGITNSLNQPAAMFFADQSTNNALQTGDSATYSLNVSSNASGGNLRVTLVWTDPPGNPAASLKLVNNLELIVTNTDNPTNPIVFFGNDFASGSVFTSTWDGNTNNIPYDTVNNVQNVYIPFPLGSNYTLTVFAKDVNVNAVTGLTNGIHQDFALVASWDDGEISNAITVTTPTITPAYMPDVTGITNEFENSPTVSGGVLLDQLVGANPPAPGTNTIGLTNQINWGTNGQITLGTPNQWHFYVVTNTVGTNATVPFFTNAAFATFLPENLSIPPVGTRADNVDDSTRPEADIDLYVARGSVFPNAFNLTNLDPTVLATCDKSLGRGGSETIIYTNVQQSEVFYVAVQSEDQEASVYAFAALFSQNPFSSIGPNGEEDIQGINVPAIIPNGTPTVPGRAIVLGIGVQPISIQRAIVTNHIEHDNIGDLLGTLNHSQISVVLNNHTFGNDSSNQVLVYNDNGDGTVGTMPSDGPGTLTSFIGQQGAGLWTLTEANGSGFGTGQVDNVTIRLDPQERTNGITATIQPGTFFYDFIDVPAEATNLTICVTGDPASPGAFNQPVDLYLRYGDLPTQAVFDYLKQIVPPGDCLSIDRSSLPPLKPGRYFFGVFNPSSLPQTVHISWTFGLDVNGVTPVPIIATNTPAPINEDAVTNSTILITNDQDIVSVNVGVVLKDPRVSDLVLTLVAPTGQRILLMENRGGNVATNLGHLNISTNFFGQTSAGGAVQTNNVLTNIPPQGVLIINYNFFTVPDVMDVFDNFGQHIFHSGFISGSNTFNIPYGPGVTSLTIIMNQGNNPVDTTAWTYTPIVVSEDFTYLTFTDDTNLTEIPIKFAIPPYDSLDNGTNFPLSDFESATNGDYVATPTTQPITFGDTNGGWTLRTNNVFVRSNFFVGTNLINLSTNRVSVVSDPNTAASGSNYLALANGSISRVIPLTPERNYVISYLVRGPGIAGWWRGEGNSSDSSDPEQLGNNGDLIGRFDFPAGEVGQAFAMEDSGLEFQFAGTNTYVQVRQSPSLDVGASGSGFTIEGWIAPTNTTFQQPIVEWLAHVPTNTIVNGQPVTNLVIRAGPFLNRANGHYYYLLGQTNWATSELWANSLGGHLAEVDDANEENFIYDTFAQYGLTNHTMWIGLSNSVADTNFSWSTGNPLVGYSNWGLGEPTNCGGNPGFVAILGPTNALPGLWSVLDNNGVDCAGVSNAPFGVVEVNEIQTNGVQFWISVTNSVTNNILTGNGRLYANIVDTNNGSHEVFSGPGLIKSNIFQHVALTYNTNTGVAQLFYNGTNVVTTNIGVFVPKTGGDVLLGKDMSRVTNNFFWGLMDEMSIYSRYLSGAEIAAIYNISASTTNRNIGKFDPGITPALSVAEAQAVFGSVTNVIYGMNNGWQLQGFSIKPTSNTLPVQITGLEPGVLLDSFFVSEEPPGNLYYLPEQPLNALVGSNAFGNWTLEIRDSRTGEIATDAQLISWELQFILQTNTPTPVQMSPQTPSTNTIPPGEVGYFIVNVPSWANDATNILVSSQDAFGNPAPVSMVFDQTTPPLTGGPDFLLLANSSAGIGAPVLQAFNPPILPSTPPLLPGQSYYLAITNAGPNSATVVVEVDFNITTLSNGVPVTAAFKTNEIERPFIFNVHSNATEATFQLLQMTGGNADLVLRKGLPLPSLTSADYGAFNGSNATETIYVLTNSAPVQLSAGPWYLDVVKRVMASDTQTNGYTMRYAVLAKELTNAPTIISISNRVPFTFTAPPGAALTSFFRFTTNNFSGVVATNISGIHFEVYNQNGNGDLTVQTNAPPLAPVFYQSSQLPSDDAEYVFIHTNTAPTNGVTVTNLMQDWYLGVPNNETNTIKFTIVGVIDTNVFASFPAAEGAGSLTRGGAFGTNVYHVTTLNDSGAGSLRDAVTSTNGGGTVVFDTAGTINLATPLFITNSGFTIAGQTAPGGNGITIAGAPTYIQDVTDIILRYLRFRPAGPNIMDSLQITNAANIIADHVSVAFGTNNVVSILNSSNITVQWSVLADSLNNTNTVTGGTSIRFGSGDVTLHHNLYSDNFSANPTIGEDVTLDFVNNVIYNWGLFAGNSTNDLVDNPGGLTNFLNYSANYLIAGTNSDLTNGAFFGSSPDTFIFQTNNFIDTNLNLVLDGANTSWGMFSNQFTEFSDPFPIEATAPDEAFIAYERVLDFAGASMDKRDAMDIGTVEQVRLFGGTNAATPAFLSGMASWWKAESNTLDSVGPNNGTAINALGFEPGEVNTAFSLDGSSSYVLVQSTSPTLNVGAGTGMTIEGWINPTGVNREQLLSEWERVLGSGSGSDVGVNFAIISDTTLFINIEDTAGVAHFLDSAPGLIIPNVWQHVAVTYDTNSGIGTMFINGTVVASANLGVFTPQTSYTNLVIGARTYLASESAPRSVFGGGIDEWTIYNRGLSQCEIQAIYNSGSAGKAPLLAASGGSGSSIASPFADVDKDGIPDFWEITLGENATNFSANADRDGDGYTDLEEYLNWLGGPHALTVTNITTNIDLYVMSGNTGNLMFGVANGTNGTVYLTNGPACEDPVSANVIAVFTPTNNFGGGSNGGFASFTYMVTNADTFAYFGPVTVSVFASSVPITNASVFSFPAPPTFEMNPNTNLMVTNIAIPTNGVTYTPINPPPFETIDTNTGIITFSPTNGPSTNIITTVATDTNVPPDSLTNTFILIVNGPPVFILQPPPNLTNTALGPITVTNGATDPDMPPSDLFYQLISPPTPTNAVIVTNTGVITWTPTLADIGTSNVFETVVTDTNGLSATNFFIVFVTPPIAPFAFTQPAQSVTGPGARFNGMATPNGIPSVAWFDYGTNTAYGNTTTPVNVGSGISVVYVPTQVGGLTPNVPYHYRLTVSNAFAVTHGFDQILDQANVVVWGANFLKQSQLPPILGNNVAAIAAAYDHSLALLQNRTVVGWGDNNFNQVNVPAGLVNVFAVAGGQYSSMALKNNGTVTAWGANVFQNVTNVPGSITNVIMIAAGEDAGVALNSSGDVRSWGANFSGITNVPPGLAAGSNIVEVASGEFHALAIRNDGTVIAWGENNAGQASVPAGLSNVVQVSGGNFHSLALKSDGTVAAWGDNSVGQTNVPAGLSNVVAIAAGGFHNLALLSDGSLVGWGDDSVGQTSFPIGLSNVVAIAAGNLHSLALTPLQLVGGTNPITVPSTNGVIQTNTILAGQTLFYQVNVPGNADFSTNSLFAVGSGGNLNMWFTTNTPPTITNVNDSLLISNAPSGSVTLTTSGAPHFTPSTTYYLGVQNTNIFSVSYGIEVEFHFISTTTLTNTAPISILHTNINGTNGFLIYWFAPSNDLFEVQWTSNLTPVINWNTFTNPNPVTYNVARYTNDPANTEFEFFDDGTQTGGFGNARSYRVILLNGGAAAPPSVLTNSAPQTNGINAGQTSFYQVTVPTNAVFATNSLLSTSGGNLNIWFSTNAPPTVGNPDDFHLLTNATSGSVTLSTNGTPQLIDGGTYYLGVQNTNNGSVIYSLAVNFGFSAVITNSGPSTNTVPISGITRTNIGGGTNAFTLVWFAPSNDLFMVQWNNNLAGGTWNTFSNIVSYDPNAANVNATNTQFDFLDDGSQTGGLTPSRYYRLILLGSAPPATNSSPVTNAVPISGITRTNIGGGTNAFTLVWFAPSNDLFMVQWNNSLVGGTWSTFSNIVSYDTTWTNINATNTEFDFLDDGSQTGGLTPGRFYRLILLNPSGGSSPSVTAIPLTNGVPRNFMTSAGSTNFFSFDITQTNAAVLFELYNLSSNALLTLQRSNLPTTSPYFATSAGPGTNYQQIVLRTNGGLPSLNAVSWFLGVTNLGASPLTYTIRAVLQTNSMLISGLPIGTRVSQPSSTNIQLSWNPTVSGEVYEIRTNGNLASSNWGALTDITASGTSLMFTNTIPTPGLPALYYWVVQVP